MAEPIDVAKSIGKLELSRNDVGYIIHGALLDLLLSQNDVTTWPGIPGNVAGENEGGYELK